MTEKSRRKHDIMVLSWGIARSVIVGVGVVALYWWLPEKSYDSIATLVVSLLASVVIWVLLVVRELIKLRNSPYPLIRLSGALVATITLLVIAFAQIYLTMDHANPGEFSQPLNKMAAMYFSMTITATVGFGDIVAKTDPARGVVTFQMFVNLVLLAAALRGLITVAQSHAKPRALGQDPASTPPDLPGADRTSG